MTLIDDRKDQFARSDEPGDRHLLLRQVDDGVVLAGITDPVEQVRLLSRVLEALLHENGDDKDAAAIHTAVHRWLPAAEEARRLLIERAA